MSQEIPYVQRYMTYDPVTIRHDQSILDAENLMRDNNIRHLPVMKGDDIFGILSDRDMKLAMSLIKVDSEVTVGQICHDHVYTADPETRIDDVAAEMAEHHFGCTVIVQKGKLVGIFTTVDACIALSEITRQIFRL